MWCTLIQTFLQRRLCENNLDECAKPWGSLPKNDTRYKRILIFLIVFSLHDSKLKKVHILFLSLPLSLYDVIILFYFELSNISNSWIVS